MLQVKCTEKIRDKQGKIISYIVEDTNGNKYKYNSSELKRFITLGSIYVINLQLTSDNRLIDKGRSKWVHSKIIHGKDKNLSFEIYTLETSNSIKTINIIVEDKGSALDIIQEILNFYIDINNVKISVRILIAGGNGRIPLLLQLCQNRKLNNIILIYDNLSSSPALLRKIKKESDIIKTNSIIISIVPICIEEFCMSFNGLINDIKYISDENKYILNSCHKHYIGMPIDYFTINPITNNYSLDGKILNTGYKSKHIKKYVNVKTKEQLIADKLADITFGNPYDFVKNANICWYTNCNEFKCKKLSNKCNKTLLDKTKIKQLILNSLFGIIYDAINIICFGKSSNIVNENVENQYLTYNGGI